MDYALAGLDSVRKAKEAEKQGYGAIVLTCHGDPNLFGLREAVRIPVLGCTQVSMHLCSLLARRFSILTPREAFTKISKEDAAVRYGFESKMASVRQISFKAPLEEVGSLSKSGPIPRELMDPLFDEAVKAIDEDGATALTTGCLFLGMLVDGLMKRFKERGIDIPIINPLPMALEMARLLIKNNLSHSALAFPYAQDYELKL